MTSEDKMEAHLRDWKRREQTAEAMIPLVGRLYRDRGVIVTVFGNSLVNKSPIEIIKLHRLTRQVVDSELTVDDSFPILEAVSGLNLAPARIDLGNLLTQYGARSPKPSIRDLVAAELASVCTGRASIRREPQDVVLYGFGRIGRLVTRTSWSARPAAATTCGCARSSCAREAPTTSPSEPACCGATPCTAPSTAPSPSMKRTAHSSSTETGSG